MADPRNERVLTLDKNPEELFQAWQKAGKIPNQYESFAQLEKVYSELLKTGLTEKAAREAMGFDYVNIDGQHLLQKNFASDKSIRYLNKRAIRTDLNIGTENLLINRGGQEALNSRKEEILMDWNKLSKSEAQQLGIETGKQFHRGHVVAGLEGGSLGQENMWPEHGDRNVLHGSEPRLPIDVIEELQIPKNDTETIYTRLLESEGLATPRLNNALMIAADENMVQPNQNGFRPSNIKGPQRLHKDSRGYTRNPDAGINPDSLLATQQRLDELEAQGISRQAIENWSKDQSGTLSRGNAVAQSGPVRVVQPPTTRVVTVVPPGKSRPTKVRIPAEAVTKAVEMGVPRSFFPNRLMKPIVKGGATVLGTLPFIGNVLDAGDTIAGTTTALDKTKSTNQRVGGALQGVSGALGLASGPAMVFPPAGAALAAASFGTGALGGLIAGQAKDQSYKPGDFQRRRDSRTGRRNPPTTQVRVPKQQDLTPAQWKEYKAGGGDASLRKGLSIQQVILQGRKNK